MGFGSWNSTIKEAFVCSSMLDMQFYKGIVRRVSQQQKLVWCDDCPVHNLNDSTSDRTFNDCVSLAGSLLDALTLMPGEEWQRLDPERCQDVFSIQFTPTSQLNIDS